MHAKKIAMIVLLLFVAASVAALVWKERNRSRAVREASQNSATNAPSSTRNPGPENPAVVPEDHVPAPPATAGSSPVASVRQNTPPATPAPVPAKGRKIVVTYFLTTTRCFSCYKIETLSESAVQAAFVGPLREGRLVWRTINTDEPVNTHYLKDYKLFTKSVIVSEVVDGREVRWKNCEKVWDLLDDPKAFESYIVKEVKAYLGDA